MNETLVKLTKSIASKYMIDPLLACAVIEQESNWNPYALRYEPAFFAKYVAPLYTNNRVNVTEAYARSFSWGLMQVMGQVAREAGYQGPLPQLCEPEFGIATGCAVLRKKLEGRKVEDGLLAWNGGANKLYATQVLARVAHYQS